MTIFLMSLRLCYMLGRAPPGAKRMRQAQEEEELRFSIKCVSFQYDHNCHDCCSLDEDVYTSALLHLSFKHSTKDRVNRFFGLALPRRLVVNRS